MEQEKQEKMIVLKIESAIHGHETLTVSVGDAMSRISTEVSENGKWLYCDGRYTVVDMTSADGRARLHEVLDRARDVTLAGMLKGG